MTLPEIKIAVAQIEVLPGHPDINVKKILEKIEKAKKEGDHLIIFPEMSVPGYLLGDEWENNAFVTDCFSYNEAIINASNNIAVIWGNVDIDASNKSEDGRIRKYNAAFIAQNRQLIGKGCVHKTLLPKYREFDDSRHFYSARKEAQDLGQSINEMFLPFDLKIDGKKIKLGLILCEDMWSDDYTINPINILLNHGAELMVNISCSPWTWRKNNKRHSVVRERIKDKPVYFIYANNVGIQNNGKNIFLFDGNSTIYNIDGTLMKVARDYTEETMKVELFSGKKEAVPNPQLSKERDIEELHRGLVYGIKKFFSNFSNKKVVIGLSGGIDSGLSAVLLTEALGAENVFAINMPSKFNSNTTKTIARQLAENLGINYATISIQNSFENTVNELEIAQFLRLDGSRKTTDIKLSALNKENIQARDRGSRVLAGVASALGAVFVNNGNKTETAFGYATLYGDVNGAIAPIADVYKMEVYQLAKYLNSKRKVFPDKMFTIPASAELSEDQNVDEGKGDPIFYPYHDKLVKAFTEFRLDPENLLEYYANGTLAEIIKCDQSLINKYFPTTTEFIADLEHKWKLFKISYFKRIQAPPIITVTKRAFGFDLRESQNGVYFTQVYLKLKTELLKR